MNHWNLVTVPEMASLIPILRLMEGLHYYRAINSTGNARIEHIKLACSYAQTIFYLETLNRQGLLPPF